MTKSDNLMQTIISAYNEPHRKYHNLQHITSMLERINDVGGITLRQFWAIWFHDFVYDLGAKDNEERSAEQAKSWLTRNHEFAHLSLADIQVVMQIIRDTQNHIATHEESKLVLDLDLQGFEVKDWRTYVKIQKKIIDENFPGLPAGWKEKWIEGRKKFLNLYMQRDPFYYTEHFNTERAMDNMNRELKMLEQSIIFDH